MTRRTHNDEDGAVLVMALIFLTVAAILTAALLSFADTGFRTTVNVRSQGQDVYGADAAVEAAINSYRYHPDCTNPPPSPTVNGVTATVSCQEGVTSSGTPSNAPKLAVIARATGSEPGITTESGETTRIRGGLYSNSSIDTSGGPGGGGSHLEVVGSVVAKGTCELNRITSDPSPECNYGPAYPEGNDPGYAAAVTTAPALRSVPSCPTTVGEPVVFTPGSYTEGALLNALFTSCAGRVFHFPANADGTVGVYYFDFADSTAANHLWSIEDDKDTVVVGGSLPSGQTLATIATQAFGQRCDQNAAGVQFIFGNDSRLSVTDGEVELCAQHDPTNTQQEIAVYGLTAGETIPAAPTPQTVTYNAPTAASTSTTPFATPDEAKAAGGGAATATVVSSSSATRTATLTLSGFSAAAIPVGATINSAVVKVTHREVTTANINQLDLTAAVTGGGGATTSSSVARNQSATMATNTLTLPASFRTIAELTGLSVAYTATAASTNTNQTARSYITLVDAIVLEVTYTEASPPPAAYLRAQAGCATATPYVHGSASTCAMVTTQGNNADLSVHGTVYAPNAALDIELVNASYQVFGRGVIVRHLRSVVTSSSDCGTTTPIPDNCYGYQLPSSVTTTGDVLFVAKVGSRTRLRALVRFNGSSTPQVKSWSVVNEV